MDVFFTTINNFLDAWIPSGSAHATEWYTLNELISYMFAIVMAIMIFAVIFYVMFWVPVGITLKRRAK